MSKISIVTLLTVLGVFASVVFADEISHRKSALELLEITDSKKLYDQVMTSAENMMAQQFKSIDISPEGQEKAEEILKEIMDWFSDFFAWEQARDMYVDIYVDVLTEDEIKELIQFYQSPLGKKMLKKMPELAQESMQKTQAIFLEMMPELQKRMDKSSLDLQDKYKK